METKNISLSIENVLSSYRHEADSLRRNLAAVELIVMLLENHLKSSPNVESSVESRV